MAGTISKQSKVVGVKTTAISHAIALLQDLPEKPKEELSLKEAVSQMQTEIRGALAKGYTYSDIATVLTGKGIKISALTLKNYVPVGKRAAAKTKSKPTQQSTSNAVPVAAPEPAVEPVPVEPTPVAKSRQGRKVALTATETVTPTQAATKQPRTRASKETDATAIAAQKVEPKQPRARKSSKAAIAEAPPPSRRRKA